LVQLAMICELAKAPEPLEQALSRFLRVETAAA
jgi:hypothetical protein